MAGAVRTVDTSSSRRFFCVLRSAWVTRFGFTSRASTSAREESESPPGPITPITHCLKCPCGMLAMAPPPYFWRSALKRADIGPLFSNTSLEAVMHFNIALVVALRYTLVGGRACVAGRTWGQFRLYCR